MMSAIECFQHAAKCEQLAWQATNDGSSMLLEIAKLWRTLGEQAKAKETAEEAGNYQVTAKRVPQTCQ
jgi:hypothetical protein